MSGAVQAPVPASESQPVPSELLRRVVAGLAGCRRAGMDITPGRATALLDHLLAIADLAEAGELALECHEQRARLAGLGLVLRG